MSGFYSHVVRRFFSCTCNSNRVGFYLFYLPFIYGFLPVFFSCKVNFFNVVIQEISEDIKSRHCDRFFLLSLYLFHYYIRRVVLIEMIILDWGRTSLLLDSPATELTLKVSFFASEADSFQMYIGTVCKRRVIIAE